MIIIQCYFLFSDKYNDWFSLHRDHEQRNYRYNSGRRPQGRGRTFYGRRPQQFVPPRFNSKRQQALAAVFCSHNGETRDDGGWQDEQARRNAYVCGERSSENTYCQHNWHEQNDGSRNRYTRGSRSYAYSSSRGQASTSSPDRSDYEADRWSSASSMSASVCRNNSLTSVPAPLSPNNYDGWFLFWWIINQFLPQLVRIGMVLSY